MNNAIGKVRKIRTRFFCEFLFSFLSQFCDCASASSFLHDQDNTHTGDIFGYGKHAYTCGLRTVLCLNSNDFEVNLGGCRQNCPVDLRPEPCADFLMRNLEDHMGKCPFLMVLCRHDGCGKCIRSLVLVISFCHLAIFLFPETLAARNCLELSAAVPKDFLRQGSPEKQKSPFVIDNYTQRKECADS